MHRDTCAKRWFLISRSSNIRLGLCAIQKALEQDKYLARLNMDVDVAGFLIETVG